MMRRLLVAIALLGWQASALAHEIYTGVHGKDMQLCCGGTDCAATHWKEARGAFAFETREHVWVMIPEDRVTFLPIPGDPGPGESDPDPSHYGHLCYRMASDTDMQGPRASSVFGPIFLYCAFIPPGGT